jgi:crossover junction endodeoxyribonuclease RusA
MTTWTLIVPAHETFLNLNQRMHWAKKASLTKAWRKHAQTYAAVAALPKGLHRVHIVAHVTKPTNRQYDVHNLLPTLKAAIDGLVDYGLIPDDTNQYLVGPDLRQGGKGDPAIVITITEIGGNDEP